MMNRIAKNGNVLKGILICVGLFADGASVFAQVPAAVEVFVDGKRYESLEKYKEARRETLVRHVPATSIKNQTRERFSWKKFLQNDLGRCFRHSVLTGRRYYLSSADIERYLEPKEDTARVVEQSVSLNGPFLEFYSRISRLGFNTGVARVVEDFMGQSVSVSYYKRLLAKDLETTLSRSFEKSDYSGPILIISHNKKLRIMTLEDRQAQNPSIAAVIGSD